MPLITKIIILHLCCSFCVVGGTENKKNSFPQDRLFFGASFPRAVVLNSQVPYSSESTWLIGRQTIQRNGKNEGNMSSLNLSSNKMFEKYDCETKLPDGSNSLHQFPMKVFNSCALADDEDLTAFKEGKKFAVVILNGKANVAKCYLFKLQNQTLQIYFEQGTDRQLQLIHVQCNVSFIDNDMHPCKSIGTEKDSEKEITADEQVINEISSDAGTIVGSVITGVAVIIGAICLASWCVIKRRRAAAY